MTQYVNRIIGCQYMKGMLIKFNNHTSRQRKLTRLAPTHYAIPTRTCPPLTARTVIKTVIADENRLAYGS